MTSEEAIELLKQYNLYSPTKQIEEAIDMAITALSAEPSDLMSHEEAWNTIESDLIRRADAMGAVQDHFNADGFKGYDDGQKMMDRIKALPSSEAVQGWIPVEEQPPVFPCLICDANGNQPSVPLGVVTITDEEHGEWHIDGRLWDTKVFLEGQWCSQVGYGNRIVAWMPLPTPYKGGAE